MVRAYMFITSDPPADFRKAGELARKVLADKHLSPQVARLVHWLMSYVLVQERDFDSALAAADKALALAPYDMFMRSRLAMVLVQADQPELALEWTDQVASRDPALLGPTITLAAGRIWCSVELQRRWMSLTRTEFNDAHLLLAIAYARLGRLGDARTEVEKMVKINPNITVQIWRQGYSFWDAAIPQRYSGLACIATPDFRPFALLNGKPDRGDEANIVFSHLRREIFSGGQFGD